MDIKKALELVVVPGLDLLPKKMDTPDSRVMLLSIGLQESRFKYRRQINGPAHCFYQFEHGGGVKGVLTHHSTKKYILPILEQLEIPKEESYDAIVYNDALATVFARLLLWANPGAMPKVNCDHGIAWDYYINGWRPSKPHRHTWDLHRIHATEVVLNDLIL